MSLIGRIFVVAFALFLAYLAAGVAFAIGMVAPDFGFMDYDPIERFMFMGAAFITTGIAVTVAIVPTLLLVVFAEALSYRSFLFYGVCGALVGAFVYFGTDVSGQLENTTDITPVRFPLQIALAAGIIAGMVYWLLAGRNAGKWRGHDPAA